MAPRIARMLIALDVEVRSHKWTGAHIAEIVSVMVTALSQAAADADPGNIAVRRYRVHTSQSAYESLINGD